jgi:hypothetical protein
MRRSLEERARIFREMCSGELFDKLMSASMESARQTFEREKATGVPMKFSFGVRETARLTGLTEYRIRKMIEDRDIQASCSRIPREEVVKLMPKPPARPQT